MNGINSIINNLRYTHKFKIPVNKRSLEVVGWGNLFLLRRLGGCAGLRLRCLCVVLLLFLFEMVHVGWTVLLFASCGCTVSLKHRTFCLFQFRCNIIINFLKSYCGKTAWLLMPESLETKVS